MTRIQNNPLEGLDERQAAAASSKSPSTLVDAGAGTGKTTTLTSRIAWLVKEGGVPAHEIMAVTFTNRAAQELKDRLQDRFGISPSLLKVGTFHSLSNRILRRISASAGLNTSDYSIADEEEARRIMGEAVLVPGAFGKKPDTEDKAKLTEWSKMHSTFVRDAMRRIALWKSWGLTETEATDPKRPSLNDRDAAFAAAYGAYQYEMGLKDLVDFGDLLLKVVTALRSDEMLLDREAGRIRHMLVDEGQDANPVQVEWVRLLTSVHGGLTVVGDEDQNIYGFQAGYPGAMSDMAGPAAARYELITNRRCTEEILKPANMAVEFNRRKTPKVLSSGRHGDPVETLHFSNNLQEADALGKKIAALIEGGAAPGEIAVLVRSYYVVGPIEEALLRHGVGALVSKGGSLLEREEVKDLVAFLQLSINPHNQIAFRRIANKPKRGLGVAGVDAICRVADAHSIPFHEACHEIVDADGSSRNKLRKDAREGAAELGRHLRVIADDGEYGRTPSETLAYILDDAGFEKWVESQKNSETRLDNVDVIKRLAEEREDTVELLNEITLLTDVEGHADRSDRVRISTIHASKGLEFDHVFCPAFDETVIPNQMAIEEGRRGKPGDVWNGPSGGGIEEERRLAHVAFTRARHTLTVSFPWQRAFPGRSTPLMCGPSSILAECELNHEAAVETERAGRRRRRSNRSRAGYGQNAV